MRKESSLLNTMSSVQIIVFRCQDNCIAGDMGFVALVMKQAMQNRHGGQWQGNFLLDMPRQRRHNCLIRPHGTSRQIPASHPLAAHEKHASVQIKKNTAHAEAGSP